jgi:hypothetical protein
MKFHFIETLGESARNLCMVRTEPEGMGFYTHYPAIGRPAVDKVSNPAVMRMDPKGGTVTRSLIGNTVNYLIASTALKDLLIAESPPATVELLPVALYNKTRLHSSDYWIVNPLVIVDCLDMKASTLQMSRGKIISIDERVLSARKLKDAPGLFRIENDVDTYVINDNVRQLIAANRKITNFPTSELAVNAD